MPRAQGKTKAPRRQNKRLPPREKADLRQLLNHPVALGVGALLLLVAGSFLTPFGERVVGNLYPPTGHLSLADVVLENVSEDPPAKPLTFDIKVQNIGDRRVVVKRIVVEINDFREIEACATEGDMSVTGTYDLVIPTAPRIGESVAHPLNQQIAADDADRFVIRAQNPESEPGGPMRSTLYSLHLWLETTGDPARVDTGRYVVALPFFPTNQYAAWYWSKRTTDDWLSWMSQPRRSEVIECLHSNSRAMREFLTRDGTRSSEASRLQEDLG